MGFVREVWEDFRGGVWIGGWGGSVGVGDGNAGLVLGKKGGDEGTLDGELEEMEIENLLC